MPDNDTCQQVGHCRNCHRRGVKVTEIRPHTWLCKRCLKGLLSEDRGEIAVVPAKQREVWANGTTLSFDPEAAAEANRKADERRKS